MCLGKQTLAGSLCSAPTSTQYKPGTRTMPRRREEVLKWNGWGYGDTKFRYDNDEEMVSGVRLTI